MNNRNANWPNSTIAQLRVLWDEGLSCSQIASVLGPPHTRNSVIGKVRRLGLPARAQSDPKPSWHYSENVKRRPPAALIEVIIPIPATSMPLSAAGNGDCRYPLWDHRGGFPDFPVCGSPTNGTSWCAFHASVVFTPSQLRRARSEGFTGGSRQSTLTADLKTASEEEAA